MTRNRDVVVRRQRGFRENAKRRYEAQDGTAGPLQFRVRPQRAGDEGERGEDGAGARQPTPSMRRRRRAGL